MSFEPTEPQDGVDPNPFTLIDPEAIPYPLTDVWSLNYAAETLRSGGEDIASGAEDMRSTWQGLQAHYEAPESETLFAKMDPVVDRGDGLESDLATVAGALEDLAEAAKTARGELNTLKIEAQSLWNRNHDNKLWWLDKDDETDEWALQENLRLKSAVNAAWATFNEAENDCATRISNLFDGPAYASPDQASGDDVLVYGLPTDAGDVDMDPLDPELSFDYVNNTVNNVANWAREEFHPDLAKFDNPYGQAVWDTVVTDVLWGTAVGFQSKIGFWHPDNGWRFDPTGRKDNAKAAWIDAGMDTAALIGIHDEHGWLWEPGEDGQEGAGAGWDRWVDNIGDTKDELIEGHTAWSTREDGVAYSNTTIATNAVMMTGGLPLKLVKIVVGSGVDMPSGDSGSGGSPGTGSGGSGSESSDVFRARGGPGAEGWPSSPLPQDRPDGATPTTERFADQLAMTQESLLDPNQHRPTPSPPTDRPTSGDASAPQAPTTPHRDESSPSQEGEGSSDRPRSEDSQRRPAGDDQSASPSRREDTDAQRNPDRELETSTSKPRSGNDPQSEGSSTPRNEEGGQGPRDDGSDRQDDVPDQHHDNDARGRTGPREETEQPTPATGSGGEGGGDQPPHDRTGLGDDGTNDRGDGTGDGEDATNSPTQNQERLLDVFPNKVDTEGRVPRPDQTAPGRYSESQVSVDDLRRDGLIDEGWESFESKEREVAQFLLDHGLRVQSVTESTVDGRTTPDAVISGTEKTIEFKILESSSPRAIEANIRKGRKQSSMMALDLRGPQVDSETVMKSIGRTLHQNGGDLDELIIIGDGYVIVWP
ncbi:CdiA C-terminal domain-containing protein [Nocardiopsis listeri]|uniref:CdiA C-terminal domain-containing protein n=1 Tax=Nocardiopsis listeri TaxID=53440 RepID=UPI00082A4160|nr:hypothetical protein [Nocardiopsis listeri]